MKSQVARMLSKAAMAASLLAPALLAQDAPVTPAVPPPLNPPTEATSPALVGEPNANPDVQGKPVILQVPVNPYDTHPPVLQPAFYKSDYLTRYYFDLDNIWLIRDHVKQTPSGANGKVVNFEFKPGLRTRFGKRTGEMSAIEAEYWGIFNWSARNADPLVALGTAPLYEASLHNVELNWRHYTEMSEWRTTSLLCGFHYFNLQEHAVYNDATPFPSDIKTTNNAAGVQVGGETKWMNGPFNVGLEGKGGLYGNYAKNHLQPALPPQIERTGTDVAGVIRAGCLLEYQMYPCLLVRGGYQLLFYMNVALAPEQQSPNTAPNGAPKLESDGTIFMHGPWIGGEVVW